MNRRSLAAKNSVIGILCQGLTTVLKFVIRSIFIKYLGVELLGINSTLVSVLNTLSLSELGFQTAVVFRLYEPLNNNDTNKINEIISIFKWVYRGIAVFFVVAGIICTPFLKYILTGIEVNRAVYIYFYLLVLNSAASYLLAYKRTLLYADKKDYVSKIADAVCNIVFTLVKIFAIIVTKNYVIYLCATICQTVVSNVIVHIFCNHYYSFLKSVKFSKPTFKVIFADVKNVFASKIAGFIYSSTDNLLLSIFTGTITVGYFVNYTTITTSLKTLLNSALNPITPIIGNMLTDGDTKKDEKILYQYSFIRFLFAVAIIVPFLVLVQDFISLWVGEDFQLSYLVPLLLAIDLYIFLLHNVFLDYINGAGLFREEKYIEIGSAVINIVLSIIMVQFWGIAGVLLGTVITQVYCWITRSLLVYKKVFLASNSAYVKYWGKSVVYIISFVLELIVSKALYKILFHSLPLWISFIAGGIMCEAVVCALSFLLFGRSAEGKYLIGWVGRYIKNRKKVLDKEKQNGDNL